ncbi:MAG: hypothetical protein ABIT09_12615, partial [Croceibacterium sp.]
MDTQTGPAIADGGGRGVPVADNLSMAGGDGSGRVSARESLAARALSEIPRLLTLQDRTPVSPTYGCFDRSYWHYRIADFPSGMAQKLVLPLALVWSLELPANPYRGSDEIRAAAEAGMRFAARAAHADGSCDDYYPFERASGAAAFSLLACLDAAEILGLAGDRELDAFFARRAHWLATHEESGRLANHEALICACLARMAERYGASWDLPLRRRLQRLLSWQSAEGWFDEYGGADPGYLTLTVAQLADLDRRRPDLALRPAISSAVTFLHAMLHPDGTLGGEYASRATVNYFPHGLEIAGAWLPLALALNDRAAPRFADAAVSDDRLFGHHLTSWLLAWREWQDGRPGPAPLTERSISFPQARMLVQVHGLRRLYLGWAHGGTFRLYDGEALTLADTGPSLALSDGRVAVSHIAGDHVVELSEQRIDIAGTMALARSARLTPAKSVVLRLIMLTAGRFFPDLVRRWLQRMLVTGRTDAPFRFRRTLTWDGSALTVHDEVHPLHGWTAVRKAGIGGFQSSLTTAMAKVW